MPPDQDRIADAKLELIRKWIEAGAMEQAGDRATTVKKSALTFDASGALQAENILPQHALRQPPSNARRVAAVSSLACAPAAPLVAIAQPNQILMFQLPTAELLAVIPTPADYTPLQVKFSRDGRYLLVAGGHHGQSGRVHVFDVSNGRLVAVVGDELDVALTADIQSNNQAIALGGPQRLLRSYDLATGERKFEVEQHTEWIQCVAYRPQGDALASGDRAGGVFWWEAETGREIRPVTGHAAAITAMDWRSDGTVMATASEDGTVRIWEYPSARQLRTVNAHGGGVSTVRFLADGRLVSGGRDNKVRLWSAELQPVAEFGPLPDVVLSVDASTASGLLVAGDWQGNVRCWQLESREAGPELSLLPPTLQSRLAAAQQELQAHQAAWAKLTKQCDDLRMALQAATVSHDNALAMASRASDELTQLVESERSAEQGHVDDSTGAAMVDIERRADQAAQQIQDLTSKRTELTRQLLQLDQQRMQARQNEEALQSRVHAAEQELADFMRLREILPQAVVLAEAAAETAESRLRVMETVRDRFVVIQSTVQAAVQDSADNAPLTAQIKSFRERTAAELANHERRVQAARSAVEDARQAVFAARMQLDYYHAVYDSE